MFPWLAFFFAGITATYDGGAVYFTTSLRLKGEDLPHRSRIYSCHSGEFRLVYSLPGEDLLRVAVSEDGRTLIAQINSTATLLIRDGAVERLNGRAFLSRNGRFLLLRSAEGDTLRNLDTAQPVLIPEGTVIPFEPTVADDGRLTAGTPVCSETYLNPAATHAVDICTRVVTAGFSYRTVCEGYIRDIASGEFWQYAEPTCRPLALSNEWAAFPNGVYSLRNRTRFPGTGEVRSAAIAADERTLTFINGQGELRQRDIRIPDAHRTLLAPVPVLSVSIPFLVPGSLLALSSQNLDGDRYQFATSTHRFAAQAHQGIVYGVVPADVPLGETEVRLIIPSDLPFEQAPVPVRVLDWQPWPAFHPSIPPSPNLKPGDTVTLHLTGLREDRSLTATLHLPLMRFSMPLPTVLYAPAPEIPGVFAVQVSLPPANQLPAPFPGTNAIPIEIEIGPAGALGTARFGFQIPVL